MIDMSRPQHLSPRPHRRLDLHVGAKVWRFLQFYGSPIAPTLEGTRFTARLLVRIILSLGHQHAKVPQVLALIALFAPEYAEQKPLNAARWSRVIMAARSDQGEYAPKGGG